MLPLLLTSKRRLKCEDLLCTRECFGDRCPVIDGIDISLSPGCPIRIARVVLERQLPVFHDCHAAADDFVLFNHIQMKIGEVFPIVICRIFHII